MKKISLIALLLTVSFIPNANAAYNVTNADRTEWFTNALSAIKGSGFECLGSAGDIGFDATKISGESNGDVQDYLGNFLYEKEYSKGAIYYIAHDFSKNGYKFCKTYISADRSDCNGEPYTEYWYSKTLAEKPDCFWLCKPGFYDDGTGCNSTTMIDTSVPDLSNIHTFDGVLSLNEVGFRYKGVQNEIPMFFTERAVRCDIGKKLPVNFHKSGMGQEHDIVLAIKSIVKDDQNNVTYTVQPMVIRAAGTAGCLSKKASHTAWALPKFPDAGVKIDNTMCPGNMLHKEEGGGCYISVPNQEAATQSQEEQSAYKAAQSKAQSLEEQGLAILCQGFDRAKYDNKVHVLNSDSFLYPNWRTRGSNASGKTPSEYCEGKTGDAYNQCIKEYNDSDAVYGDASATCTVFVCKDEGMGYKSDPMGAGAGDFTCVSCMQNDDTTIHPSRLGVGSDGICKVCAVGEVYSSTSKTCEKAKSIHKYYMGGLLTQNETEPRELNKQCWTMPTPDAYKDCIADTGYADALKTE